MDIHRKTRINKRLVIASNRFPLVIKKQDSRWCIEEGTGGLLTAMEPVLRQYGGLWLGWPGMEGEIELDEVLSEWQTKQGYQLQPVFLTAKEYEKFYYGFSNEILWPLFHDLQSRCNFFDTHYGDAYEHVNSKFAQAIAGSYQHNDYIWVHDYQLISVAKHLRNTGIDAPTSFFLLLPRIFL